MKKNSKKALATTMCTVMMLGAVAPIVSAKAEVAPSNRMAISSFSLYQKIESEIALADKITVSQNNSASVIPGIYNGTLSGKITLNDLFSDFLTEFNENYKGKREQNLVMFNEGKQYPSIKYTIKFPDTAKIQNVNTLRTNNQRSISNFTYVINNDNSVTFELKLGNWDDYISFFTRLENEINTYGDEAYISFDINYDVPENDTNMITGEGLCSLWYYGRLSFFNSEIVKITTDQLNIKTIAGE